jgi:hypothetical protein
MESVELNNTLQEDWHAAPDSGSEWSHCPVAPLYITTMSLAGIQPLEPGFARCEIRPQRADLEQLELTVRTVQGPIEFRSRGMIGSRELTLQLPSGCEGELAVSGKENLELENSVGAIARGGLARYRIPAGKTTAVHLRYT